MAGPFFNNIKATSSGAAGTGAFTPSSAVLGALDWTNVPSGWIGLVRFDDGTASELRYSYWNGTTLARATNAFVWSTTGSALSLSSSATAELVIDGLDVQPHLGGTRWGLTVSQLGANTIQTMGMTSQTNNGTPSLANLATTNFLTEQAREVWTSLTTANAAAGPSNSIAQCVFSTAAGRGGGEFVARFGASQLPTGPKLVVGLSAALWSAANEPSAQAFNAIAFTKDSTDTNIQFLTKDGTTAHKIDTGIPLTANGWYEASVWFDPGGAKAWGLLIRLDTGDIWFGSTTSNLPANGSLLLAQIVGSLSATTGTAFIMNAGSMSIRTGI